ncbi:MAG: hypothetical protein AB7V46_14195 [Thermomicrobiales bacterium]|uniref:hypothetical protein n=1 Tax=Pseudorhodoplanes sp. TaxID=1934341 RepID=UPI003D1432B5
MTLSVLLTVTSCDSARTNSTPEANGIDPANAAGGNALTDSGIAAQHAPAQLAEAFRVAFADHRNAELTVAGYREPDGGIVSDQTYAFRPFSLEWLGGTAALISLGRNLDDSHVSSGALAIHYLNPTGDSFTVIGSWPRIVDGASFGAEPLAVAVSRSLAEYPVVYSEGGGTWSGTTCGWAHLVELRPGQPIATEGIPISHSNEGADGTVATLDGGSARTIEGRIGNIDRGRSFDVIFTGTERFVERYAYRNHRWMPTVRESRAAC